MLNKTKILILLIIMALTAVACGGSDEDEPAVEEAAAPEVAAEQVEEPAVEETAPEEAPAEAPAEPAAEEAAPEPTAVAVVAEAPARQRFGIVRFRDGEGGPSSDFQMLMDGIAPPSAGTHYVLWLVDDSFNILNLGQFEVSDGNAQHTGSTDQNLLAAYNGAFISIEQDGVSDGEIGPISFEGLIPAGAFLHIRHIATGFPANPGGKGFLIGAQDEMDIAIEHSGLLQDALAAGDIDEAHRHAEHIVNILDGEAGVTFGDLDGDGTAQNPGDGVGVRGHLEGAKQHTNLATDAEDATAEIELHAGHVLVSSDNALARIQNVIEQALRVIASDSTAEAQGAADEIATLLDGAMNGVDANGDGNVAPIVDEGGILTAYVHAQNMGSFEFFATDDAAVAAPAAPAEEPAVEEPAADEPAAAAVTVDMENFAFSSTELTVSTGTAVTWVNRDGGPKHSATASDGSFDTDLFDSGEQATITFDTPGTFVYYCLLHGAPDGSGMAATITVTE